MSDLKFYVKPQTAPSEKRKPLYEREEHVAKKLNAEKVPGKLWWVAGPLATEDDIAELVVRFMGKTAEDRTKRAYAVVSPPVTRHMIAFAASEEMKKQGIGGLVLHHLKPEPLPAKERVWFFVTRSEGPFSMRRFAEDCKNAGYDFHAEMDGDLKGLRYGEKKFPVPNGLRKYRTEEAKDAWTRETVLRKEEKEILQSLAAGFAGADSGRILPVKLPSAKADTVGRSDIISKLESMSVKKIEAFLVKTQEDSFDKKHGSEASLELSKILEQNQINQREISSGDDYYVF